MALVGVSITKRCAFRDSTQEFSNVYHYSYTGLNPSETLAGQIAAAIVTIEKTFHSTDVTFMRYRVWSAGGSIAQNTMIAQGLLSGTGSAATSTAMDRERAVLVQWPAGFDSRGHAVRLKKWFHSCGAFGTVTMTNTHLTGASGFSSADRTTIQNYVDDLEPLLVNAQSMSLVAESGRTVTGPVVAHKYLEHHQLGDQWRSV
jgi:hypothetical protein